MRGKKIALPQHFTPRSFSFKREPLHKKHPLVEPVFQITTRHVRVLPRRDIKDPLSNRHHHFPLPPLSRYLLCKCLDQNPYSLALRMTRDSDEIWTDRRFEKRRLAGRLSLIYTTCVLLKIRSNLMIVFKIFQKLKLVSFWYWILEYFEGSLHWIKYSFPNFWNERNEMNLLKVF